MRRAARVTAIRAFALVSIWLAAGELTPRRALAVPPPATYTTKVSVTSLGTESAGASGPMSAASSRNGRYIAFQYNAQIVPSKISTWYDVFVRDVSSGTTEQVSVSSSGTPGNATSGGPAISSDGRYVAFNSSATNLVAGDTNGQFDVFLRDRQTGITSLVSVSSSGAQGNGASTNPSISGDGRYITFQSSATNLIAGDTNGKTDIFVRDLQAGTTTRVSVDSAGVQGNDDSTCATISGEGGIIAYLSSSTNLVTGDSNAVDDMFVYDRSTSATSRISVDSSGAQANARTGSRRYQRLRRSLHA